MWYIPSAPHLLILDYVLQVINCLAYLVLMVWSAVHHGWWMHINPIVACGGISSKSDCWSYRRRHANIYMSVVLALSTILAILYFVCHTLGDRSLDGPGIHHLTPCRRFKFMSPTCNMIGLVWGILLAAMVITPKGKDFRNLFDQPPYTAWGVAGSLAVVEVYVSTLSLLLHRPSSSSFPRHQWPKALETEGQKIR